MDFPVNFMVTTVVDESTVSVWIEPVGADDLLCVYVDGAEVAPRDEDAIAIYDAMRALEDALERMQWVHVERLGPPLPPRGL